MALPSQSYKGDKPLPLEELHAGVAKFETLIDFTQVYATLLDFRVPFWRGAIPSVVTMGVSQPQCVRTLFSSKYVVFSF